MRVKETKMTKYLIRSLAFLAIFVSFAASAGEHAARGREWRKHRAAETADGRGSNAQLVDFGNLTIRDEADLKKVIDKVWSVTVVE